MSNDALPVRVFARLARGLGVEGREASADFARLYGEARRAGWGAAQRLFLASLLDLAAALWTLRRPRPLRAISQDVRWSGRVIRKNPLASLAVVASIGLAMGANTAAFSVINAFLFRSWSTEGLDRVVRVREDYARPGQPPDIRGFSLASFGPWQRENTVFESMAAGRGATGVVMWDGRPERVAAGMVTANFFSVLGMHPAIGRTFTAEEDTPSRRDAVILGDSLWRSRFGARPDVIGKTLDLNGRVRTIVGVMPRGFKHPYQSDLWVPLGYQEDPANTGGVYVPARLKPGVSVDEANRALDALALRRWQANPGPAVPSGASVTYLRPEMLGRLTRVLYLLGAAAGLVLMIATANVGNLLLAQSLGHQAESAVRTALGASRSRLVRQYVVHSLMLAALGGAAGILLTFWSVEPLVALSPLYGAGEFDIAPRLDWPTLAFSAGMIATVGVVLGTLPALRASRANAAASLADVGRSGTMSSGSRRWLNGLVVVELALAFVLTACAVSMGQGFVALARETWGLDRRNVVTFDVAGGVPVLKPLLTRVSGFDGVSAAGATSTAPFYAGTEAAGFNIETPPPEGREALSAHVRVVTPGYFAALGIPVRAGRDFSDRDTEAAPRVVIVSESLAARYWPGASPVGRRLKAGRWDGPGPWMEVVGVVGSLRENPQDGIPGPDAWYLPYEQAGIPATEPMTVVIKTLSPAPAVVAAAADALREIDPRQPIFDAVTLDQRFRRFTSTESLTTVLTLTLGGLGLALAATGVYAMMAFMIRRRLPELGLRASFGARPADIRNLVLREAAVLGGLALLIGMPAAAVALPWLDAGLFPGGLSTALAFPVAAVGTTAAAMASAVIPARRAARINLISAIKS